MYAKIFCQIFDSSIADNYELRHFFMDLLVLANGDGIVDMTQTAISARTRIPIGKVTKHLEALQLPDPQSRTHEDMGRRIVLIDPERGWGWSIVNYQKYRQITNDVSRTEYMREYMRNRRSVNNPVNKKLTTVNEGANPASASASASASVPKGDARGSIEKSVSVEIQASKIYDEYPRKVARRDAIKAILSAIKRGHPPEALLDLAKQYSDAVKNWPDDEKKFVPYPATWFNKEMFNDDPSTWEKTTTKPEPRKWGEQPTPQDRALDDAMEKMRRIW